MFEADDPLFVRGLSLFHVVLPLFLAWLVYRLGYDDRAWIAQTIFFCGVVLLCFFFTNPAENINWVFSPGSEPQQKVPSVLYLVLLVVLVPLCVYLPTHLLLRAVMPRYVRDRCCWRIDSIGLKRPFYGRFPLSTIQLSS